MSNQVALSARDGTAIMSICRPEALNALSRPVVDEMEVLFDQIAADPSVRVLLIYSEKNFASGADIKEMIPCDPQGARTFLFTPVYNKLQALSIPTIAVMDGYAFGGGLELALRCDFRICSSRAKMGFPEINLGIMPGAGGTVLLPRLIGEAKAKELIFYGKTVRAEDAERMGLVHAMVEPEKLLDTAVEWADQLKVKAPVALAAAKRAIEYGIGHPDYREATEHEAQLWSELFATQDQKEGMIAFLEKRKPNFVGC